MDVIEGFIQLRDRFRIFCSIPHVLPNLKFSDKKPDTFHPKIEVNRQEWLSFQQAFICLCQGPEMIQLTPIMLFI